MADLVVGSIVMPISAIYVLTGNYSFHFVPRSSHVLFTSFNGEKERQILSSKRRKRMESDNLVNVKSLLSHRDKCRKQKRFGSHLIRAKLRCERQSILKLPREEEED